MITEDEQKARDRVDAIARRPFGTTRRSFLEYLLEAADPVLLSETLRSALQREIDGESSDLEGGAPSGLHFGEAVEATEQLPPPFADADAVFVEENEAVYICVQRVGWVPVRFCVAGPRAGAVVPKGAKVLPRYRIAAGGGLGARATITEHPDGAWMKADEVLLHLAEVDADATRAVQTIVGECDRLRKRVTELQDYMARLERTT